MPGHCWGNEVILNATMYVYIYIYIYIYNDLSLSLYIYIYIYNKLSLSLSPTTYGCPDVRTCGSATTTTTTTTPTTTTTTNNNNDNNNIKHDYINVISMESINNFELIARTCGSAGLSPALPAPPRGTT